MLVTNEVKEYFENNLSNYTPLEMRETDIPYIFRVLAKKKHNSFPQLGDYAVWTCWNVTTKSLNHGHYDLDYETAKELLDWR